MLQIHSGIIRIEGYRSGTKNAGDTDQIKLGDFSEDSILVAIVRDPDSDAGSSSISMKLEVPIPEGKRTVIDDILSDSILFDGGLDGGRIELNLPIPAQNDFKLKFKWGGTASIGLLFLYGAPLISYDQFAAMATRSAVGMTKDDKPRRMI